MTTTLLAAEQLLSKELGDYWSSTTTSAGSTTTLVDTALMAKANDWITDDTWVFLIEEPSGAAAIYDERKVSSLDNTTGTLTTLAFSEAPGTGIDYELHRLFTPSEKRRALVAAAKNIFPSCFQEVWNEELVSGNWLKDGSFERWTSTSALTDWTKAGSSTLAQTSTAYLFKHGAYSCKISGAADNIRQSVTNFDDLKHLAGKSVTFSVQGWCDTASCLRIAIYDGTTYTYSSYHDGADAWTEHNDPLTVTAAIKDNPTIIAFIIYHDNASGTSYVDDARVISSDRSRLYIGHLGLAKNQPHRVYIEPDDYSQLEPWYMVRDWAVDKDGYLYLPASTPNDYRLRIQGIGYFDFLASGVSSTAWTATINLDYPQTEILVAEAALYLYTWMSMPNFESGTRKDYQQMSAYWKQEAAERKAKFGMISPGATVSWGSG